MEVSSIGSYSWTFAVDTGERLATGGICWLKLVRAAETPIRRFVKIQAEANPFDPHWDDYFVDRAFFKKFGLHRREAGVTQS